MDLDTSTVHRKLDAKLKIAGLEAPDLLSILIFAAIMNLFFGRSGFAPLFVVVLPLIGLAILYFGKRDKPEGFLIHLIRFYFAPGFLSAGEESQFEEKMRQSIYGE